jgi:streptogramin lyase
MVKVDSMVSVERVGDAWLVLDSRTSQVHRLRGDAASVLEAITSGAAVPADLDGAVAALLEMGVLTSDARWTRRRALVAGTAAAAAVGVSTLALPSAVAASSAGGPTEDTSTTTTSTTTTTTLPEGPAVAATVSGSGKPFDLTSAFGSIWFSNDGTVDVSRIDPATNTVTDTIDVGGLSRGIIGAEGSIWVAVDRPGNDVVARIDPATGAITNEVIISGGSPYGIAFDGTDIRVSSGDVVHRISPSTQTDTAAAAVELPSS